MLVKPNPVNVYEVPGNSMSLDGVKEASSLELMEIDAKRLPASEQYRLYQHRDNSWSHNGDWGTNAVKNVNVYWAFVGRKQVHYEDDIFCDFGGNDGTVAESWRVATGNPVYSVDLDNLKQQWGRRSYPKVNFINSLLEEIPLKDQSVDWGFCSHTLEHVADIDKALDELARIVRRAIFIVVPLEHPTTFWQSNSHMRSTSDPLDWLRTLRRPEWQLANWGKPIGLGIPEEMYMLYTTKDNPLARIDLNRFYLDEQK